MNWIISLLSLGMTILVVVTNGNPISPDQETFADSCTLSGSSLDNLSKIKSSCISISIKDLNVPAGKTLDLSGLKKGTKVAFKGTIKFGFKNWKGPLITVSGTDITVQGSTDNNKLDGQGAKYWDGKGGNGGVEKPKFFQASKLYDSTIKDLNIHNTPVHVFSIKNCKNVTVNRILIENSAGDSKGHNTDGFDVGDSSYIYIKNSKIYNQDDCLAINSGSDIYFTNNYCRGGHGISIGSVGGRSNNEVKNVNVKHCQIVDSTNGVRIKTVHGATGSVKQITYENITLSNISKYGITIRGDYKNSGSVGTPTSGVPITKLTLKNIKGNCKSSATNIMVLVKGASDWKWSGVNVSGGKTSKECSGIPSGSNAKC